MKERAGSASSARSRYYQEFGVKMRDYNNFCNKLTPTVICSLHGRLLHVGMEAFSSLATDPRIK